MSKLKIKDLNTVANVYQIPTTGTGATITGSLEGDVIVIDGNSSAYTIKASGSKVTISGINDFGKKFTVTVTFDKSKAAVAQTAKFAFADGTVELGYNPATKTVTSGGTPVGKTAVGASTLPVDNTVTADSFEGATGAGGSTPVLGQTFTLNQGLDTVQGSAGNDTIDGRARLSLDQFDVVNGGAGRDTLIVDNDTSGQGEEAALPLDLRGVRSVEVITTTADFTELAVTAVAAGVDTLNLNGQDQVVNLVGFASALAVNGNATNESVFVDLSLAGNKTLNLGADPVPVRKMPTQQTNEPDLLDESAAPQFFDTVEAATKQGDASGSIEVRFVSSDVGNGTNTNVSIIGSGSTATVNDEGTVIEAFGVAEQGNVFRVQGVTAAGAVDPTQNRGDFSYVVLGTSQMDDLDTKFFGMNGPQGNVYINAGAGDDVLAATAAAGQRHFVVGGAGDDTILIDTAPGGVVEAIAGAGNDDITVGVLNATSATSGIEKITLVSGTNTVTYAQDELTLNTAKDALGNSLNDVLTGGTGRDTLISDSATLVNIKKAAVAADQSITGFEEVAVSSLLQGQLKLSNIQAGIDTVVLENGADGESVNGPVSSAEIVFDAGIAGTVKLANDLEGDHGCHPEASGLTVTAAGSGSTDTLTIVNATAAHNATPVFLDGEIVNPAVPTTANDGFQRISINSSSVETLILDGTGLASENKAAAVDGTQFIESINLTGSSIGTPSAPAFAATTVKFIGKSGFVVGLNAESLLRADNIDASGLTGPKGLTADTTARNVIGSSVKDDISFFGETSAAKPADGELAAQPARNASIDVGAGDDQVIVSVFEGSKADGIISIKLGAGNDRFSAGQIGSQSLNIDAGTGADVIDMNEELLSKTDVIDGGADNDTLVVTEAQLATTTAASIDDPLIVLRNIVKNVERLEISGEFDNDTQDFEDDTFDVSTLNKVFQTIAFTDDNAVSGVTTETIEAVFHSDLTVTAKDFKLKTDATATVDTFGGDLKLVANSDDFDDGEDDIVEIDLTAFANNVTLDVVAQATKGNDVGAQLVVASLEGAIKTVVVNLSSSIDTSLRDAGSESRTDGQVVKWNNFAAVSINAEANDSNDGDFEKLSDLTTVTLKGNGFASVQNENGSKLATIDASQLNSVFGADYVLSTNDAETVFGDFSDLASAAYGTIEFKAGDKSLGLILESENASVVETVKLGGGLDIVLMDGGSTVAKTDTIEGLSLVLKSNGDLDFSKSDVLLVTGFGPASTATPNNFRALTTEEKAAVAGKSLELTLLDLQASTDEAFVFTNGGNTYVYADTDLATLNGDVLVKLTGTIDEAALLASLNGAGLQST